MELYLKLGNQNIFFIFVQNHIVKSYIFPSYITINKEGRITNFGPYSLLQYIIFKQLKKIINYPNKIQNKNYFLIKRLIENNLIENYKDFFYILQNIFSGNLLNIYNLDLCSDYEKYNIPFFLDIQEFYYFLKNVNKVKLINFIEEKRPEFKNQISFLKDIFKYFRLKIEVINFCQYFQKFFPALINVYIGEENSFIWIMNKYQFLIYKRIDFKMRKLKEIITEDLAQNGNFPSYLEVENNSLKLIESLYNNHDYKFKQIIKDIFIKSFHSLLKETPPSIIEDIYSQNDIFKFIQSYNSVIKVNPNISKMVSNILDRIIIKG